MFWSHTTILGNKAARKIQNTVKETTKHLRQALGLCLNDTSVDVYGVESSKF